MKRYLLNLLSVALIGVGFTANLHAQTSAFTYQGSLMANEVPFSGSAEFQFTLWDAASGGEAVATNNPPQIVIPVTNGLFTAELDFGDDVFAGSERFLQIEVRTTIGAFKTLVPRQPIGSNPYAIQSVRASEVPPKAITTEMLADDSVTDSKIESGAVSQLGTPDGSNPRALQVTDNGFVGIGTVSPAAGLQVTRGADASLGSGGYIISGRADGRNVAIDDNEIMARQNGSAAILFLNNNGGTVRAGEDLEVLGNVRAYQRLFVKGRFSVQDMPFGDYRNVQWDDSSLQFFQDNSSRRYKENIRPLADDFQKILFAQPKTYTRPGRPDRWEIGLIAEEVDALGLTQLVDYDEQGRPDGVKYDKLPLYLIKVAADQDDAIKTLQAQNAGLKTRIEKLEDLLKKRLTGGAR